MVVVLVLCGGGPHSGQQSKVRSQGRGMGLEEGQLSRVPTGQPKRQVCHKFKAQICLEATGFHSWPCRSIRIK